MVRRCLSWLAGLLPEHRRRTITRDDGRPYLYRHYLIGGPGEGWGIFLHRFVASDPTTELHSHPWTWSLSLILWGGYLEERWREPAVDAADRFDIERRQFGPGRLNQLGPRDFHRVELGPSGEAWTLFLHGPRFESWSFIDRATRTRRTITKRTFDRAEESERLIRAD
jgi:hypothetical protein